ALRGRTDRDHQGRALADGPAHARAARDGAARALARAGARRRGDHRARAEPAGAGAAPPAPPARPPPRRRPSRAPPDPRPGTPRGLHELAGLPYVGAGVLASAVGMDKAVMKSVFRDAGIPVCRWLVTRPSGEDPPTLARRIDEAFGFPCFVKPANLGSSVGI